jgi:hypothetical protein
MRWRMCDCCDSEEDTKREDNTIVKVYECHCCWNDYCDTCGDEKTRICVSCLDEAYINNYGHPYIVDENDPMGVESAPDEIKQQAELVSTMDWSDCL